MISQADAFYQTCRPKSNSRNMQCLVVAFFFLFSVTEYYYHYYHYSIIMIPRLLFTSRVSSGKCQKCCCRHGTHHNTRSHPQDCGSQGGASGGISQIGGNQSLKLPNARAHIVVLATVCHQLILQLYQPSVGMIVPALEFSFPPFRDDCVLQKVQNMRVKGIDAKIFVGSIDCLDGSFWFEQPQLHFATDDKRESLVIVKISGPHDVFLGIQHIDAFASDAQSMNFAAVVDENGRDGS